MTGEQASASAAAVAAFSAGAARGHHVAALELAELDAALDAVNVGRIVTRLVRWNLDPPFGWFQSLVLAAGTRPRSRSLRR